MKPETGAWPTRRSKALDWLARSSGTQPFLDNLFGQVCELLVEDGLPIDRGTLHLRTLHPQFMGARVLWRPGLQEPEIFFVSHSVLEEPRFLRSPVRALYEGAEGIRQRLDLGPPPDGDEYGIYAELREAGMTDYVALPVQFTDGKRHATSWATTRPGGFTTADLIEIDEILPVLGMALEIRLNRRIAKNLLNAYVGEHAGELILAGQFMRGTGTTVRAAIWNSDLRGFTQIADQWPRDDVISWLNEYFDTVSAPVVKHGGEILKFIGDGMLAIFPLESAEACNSALLAAVEARRAMRAMNEERMRRGLFELGFGLALHVGDVMYGNIGTATRLDFTVIGPAVNVASRLQTLSRDLRRQVLISAPFAYLCGCSAEFLTSLGSFPLRGVGEPIEVFGLTEER